MLHHPAESRRYPPLLRLGAAGCTGRFDLASEELLRDPSTGLCLPCAVGEAGQVLGLINDTDPSRRFDGYTDRSATARKIVENVLRHGDRSVPTECVLTECVPATGHV